MSRWLSIGFTSVLMLSCQTSKDSTMLGLGVGSIVGAGFGAAAGASNGKESKGALTGAAVGAALGGLMGFLDHKERSKKFLKKEKFGFKRSNGEPYLTDPQVRKIWVPEKINGNKYEAGHWMYIIQTPSTWRKDD